MEKSFLFIIISISASSLALDTTHDFPELSKRAIFPPFVPDQPTGEDPIGHKQHLGTQNKPVGPVKEYTKILDAQTLWETHVKPHIPLVYRGVIKDSPAVKLWDDAYLAEHYGDLDVLVEHKKEDRQSSSGRMMLADFLKHYKSDDLYVVSMFPSEMMHQVRGINSMMCSTFRNHTHESNLWISAGGTRSVVHYDADHNFHCMIDGRKDFIMIPNNLATKTNLYFKQKDPGVGSGFSFLNPDSIDMKKFPRIAKVPWTWATLYPGDCIFIPSVYIHQVRGYGRTLAVTTLFTADVQNNFNSDDCTPEIMTNNYTMADIKFLWSYKKGDPTIDMGYMNTELVKDRLHEALRDEFAVDGKMSMKQFVLFSGVFSPYGRNRTKIVHIWKNVFNFDEKTMLDVEKIESLSLDQLKTYCRAIEAPHGVVTNGSEPVFVRPGERHKWEMETDYEDDDSDRQEEDEEEIARIAQRDNMLEHLSPEEREEYIRQRQAEFEARGAKYEGKMLDESKLSEEQKILMELSWRLEDVPDEYKRDILRGQIPADFKEEFMEALPDTIKERYKKYFKKGKIPKVMIRAIAHTGGDDYKIKVLKEKVKEEL